MGQSTTEVNWAFAQGRGSHDETAEKQGRLRGQSSRNGESVQNQPSEKLSAPRSGS
jgi:hypothetical protein